jgi:hypothetical protein
MNKEKWKGSGGAITALALMFCMNASAQQIPQAAVHHTGSGSYDLARESVLEGKVLQYSAASKTAPLGAHISLQTSSGTVDVHAGNAKLLEASHISLQAGDSVSITGENVAFGNGTIFLARLIQKGTQAVAVRSKNGMPLLPSARTADGRIVSPAGAR